MANKIDGPTIQQPKIQKKRKQQQKKSKCFSMPKLSFKVKNFPLNCHSLVRSLSRICLLNNTSSKEKCFIKISFTSYSIREKVLCGTQNIYFECIFL